LSKEDDHDRGTHARGNGSASHRAVPGHDFDRDIDFDRGVFLDEVLPNNDKLIGNVAGGLSQTGKAKPRTQAGREFLCAFVRILPGQGTSLHSHGTTETFLVLEGRFVVTWEIDGDNDEGLCQIEPVPGNGVP
jgi:mannose-6-phosphate isomerase-like protein (cupin superfamily)